MAHRPLPTPSPDVLVATLDDEAVLLDLASKRYFQLNETGTVIWEGMQEGADHETLVARLVERFAVEEDEAVAAVDAFVGALRERGLAVDAPGAG